MTTNGAGVYHCAIAKDGPGGTGGNAIPPVCFNSYYVYTGCYPEVEGYATIINQSSSAHKFWGQAWYSGSCA